MKNDEKNSDLDSTIYELLRLQYIIEDGGPLNNLFVNKGKK